MWSLPHACSQPSSYAFFTGRLHRPHARRVHGRHDGLSTENLTLSGCNLDLNVMSLENHMLTPHEKWQAGSNHSHRLVHELWECPYALATGYNTVTRVRQDACRRQSFGRTWGQSRPCHVRHRGRLELLIRVFADSTYERQDGSTVIPVETCNSLDILSSAYPPSCLIRRVRDTVQGGAKSQACQLLSGQNISAIDDEICPSQRSGQATPSIDERERNIPAPVVYVDASLARYR